MGYTNYWKPNLKKINETVEFPKEMLEKMQKSDNFKGDSQTRKSIFERFRNYFS